MAESYNWEEYKAKLDVLYTDMGTFGDFVHGDVNAYVLLGGAKTPTIRHFIKTFLDQQNTLFREAMAELKAIRDRFLRDVQGETAKAQAAAQAAQEAQKLAEKAQKLAQDAQGIAEAARDDAMSAKSAAEAAQRASELARDAALTAQQAAEAAAKQTAKDAAQTALDRAACDAAKAAAETASKAAQDASDRAVQAEANAAESARQAHEDAERLAGAIVETETIYTALEPGLWLDAIAEARATRLYLQHVRDIIERDTAAAFAAINGHRRAALDLAALGTASGLRLETAMKATLMHLKALPHYQDWLGPNATL